MNNAVLFKIAVLQHLLFNTLSFIIFMGTIGLLLLAHPE